MMKKFINKRGICSAFVFTLLIVITTDLNAQNQTTKGLPPEVMAWTVSTMEPWPPDKYKSLKEAMIDNNFFPNLVFRGGLFPKLDNTFNLDSLRLDKNYPLPSPIQFKGRSFQQAFFHIYFLKLLNDMVYKEVMLANPRYFKYTIWDLPSTVIKPESIEKSKDQVKIDVKPSVTPPAGVDPVIKFIPDRRYWTSTFAADIKFSQNKSSANWYNGEINTMNIYTNTNTSYNYARNKLSLTNVLTTTFTVTNVQNDTLRKYAIGSDELRFRSNFGLRAIKNWNYSASGEFITSMGNKYIANTTVKNSAFLSPFTVNAGVGMTYAVKPVFKKPDRALDLSLSLEPLSFKYMFSRDTLINLAVYFPIDENGKYMRLLKTFGSTITMTQTAKLNKSVTLYTRIYYFTNYERIISEVENKLDIILNKYFSTTIHVFLRYDDGVVKKEGSDTFLQINELFAFGFSYRW